MCGYSVTEIRNREICLFFGDSGGSIIVDTDEGLDAKYRSEDSKKCRNRVRDVLGSFEKAELIEILLSLAENGEEG